MQRQHARVQVARGEYAVRQSHHPGRNDMTSPRQSVVDHYIAVDSQRVLSAVEFRCTSKCERARELHCWKELRQQAGVEIGEAKICAAISDRIGHRRLYLTGDVGVDHCHIHIAGEIHALVAGPIETEIELAGSLLGQSNPRPANVGRIYRIPVKSKVQIGVIDVVFPVAGSFRLREGDARTLPPERIAGEVKRAGESAHVCDRRTEWRRYHRERRHIDATVLVGRIFEPHQRKNSVDFVESEFFLISVRDPENLQPFIRPQRATHHVLLLSSAFVRIGLPWRAHGQVTLYDCDVAKTNPRPPSGFAWACGRRRVARKDAIVIPFSARLLVDHDDRPHQLHFAEINSLSAQRGQTVARPHLVRFDERRVRAVGDHDIVQRESAQKISGNFPDVNKAVTVSLYQPFDVATDALAAPIAVGDEQGCAK